MPIDFEASSNQWVTLPAGILSALQARAGATLMGWFNVETFVTNTENWGIYFSNGTNNTQTRLSITARNSTKFRTTSRRLDADAATSLDSTLTPSTGVWYHVAAVAEWNNAILRLYINGAQDNSVAIAGWTGNSSNTASLGASIGVRADALNTTDFDGIMKDLRVYNYAVVPNHIASIYRKGGADTVRNGGIARWKMNGPAGTSPSSVLDSWGGLHGTAVGSPVYSAGWMKRRMQ